MVAVKLRTASTVLSWSHRIAMAVVLGVFGVSKVSYLASLQSKDALLPPPLLIVTAVSEMALAGLLVFYPRRIALWLAAAFGVALLSGTMLLVWAGYAIEACGCFGVKQIDAYQHVGIALGFRSLGLSALSLEDPVLSKSSSA